jgi:alkylation response protein AidB-like acyl-CoA dehydrogenase
VPLDFELSEEQKMLQNSAREFAGKELTRDKAVEWERQHDFPWDIYRKVAQQGYIGMHWPPEYGGQGLGVAENLIVAYEFCKADPPLGASLLAGTFGSDIIAHNGTPEQKAKWLPRLAKGEITSAGCFTEPGGGSDISRVLETRAKKSGNAWLINGSKTFITNASTASIFVTLTQTDTEARPGYRGQSEFIIEKSPSVSVTPLKGKMGWHTSPTGEVVFTDVEVADDAIIGGPEGLNRGFYFALGFLDEARLSVGNMAIATAEAALDKAVSYSLEREAFGRKIAGFQGLAFRLVEMATEVELAKSLLLRGSWIYEKANEEPALREESIKVASMCKWYGARLAVQSCDLMVDTYGGSGYFAEEDVSRWYTFAKQFELVEGTKEVQKNAIARIMFGNEIAKTH